MANSLLLGLGFSFYSGAVDALAATGYHGPLERVFARGQIVSGAAMLIGSVGGGVLGSLELAWPFLARSLLLGAAFLVGLVAMHDIGFTPGRPAWRRCPGRCARCCAPAWSSAGKPGRSAADAGVVGAGDVHDVGLVRWQPYLLGLLGRDAVWVAGVVTALTALATIAGNAPHTTIR